MMKPKEIRKMLKVMQEQARLAQEQREKLPLGSKAHYGAMVEECLALGQVTALKHVLGAQPVELIENATEKVN